MKKSTLTIAIPLLSVALALTTFGTSKAFSVMIDDPTFCPAEFHSCNNGGGGETGGFPPSPPLPPPSDGTEETVQDRVAENRRRRACIRHEQRVNKVSLEEATARCTL
jgi:hypothetical protein